MERAQATISFPGLPLPSQPSSGNSAALIWAASVASDENSRDKRRRAHTVRTRFRRDVAAYLVETK
jgi:hypothetical protein